MARLPRSVRRGLAVTACASALCTGLAAAAGYLDPQPYHFYPAAGRPAPVAILNVSGDMGLRFLLGASTSRGLTARGYAVLGVTSPVLFRRRRTSAEITAIVADAMREAMARTGARDVVVMGQSYGADVVQTGLAGLPPALRRHVAAIVLVLPGDAVFFRADPTGLAYHGAPDSIATRTADTLDWAPLTCIYGVEESDSLCPRLRVPGARIVGMPGDHDIAHDADGLLAHVLEAIARRQKGSPG